MKILDIKNLSIWKKYNPEKEAFDLEFFIDGKISVFSKPDILRIISTLEKAVV